MKLRGWCAVVLVLAGSPAVADQSIYIDGLQNGWADFSFGAPGSVDFANPAPFHDGAPSIRLSGNNFNAISFAHTGQNFSTANFPQLRLWVHGGASGGQQLRLFVQLDNAQVTQVELDSSISGGVLVAGQWRQVTVDLASLLAGLGGQFDRFDLQSDVAGTQLDLFVDDVVLLAPAPVGADPLFANGFEDGVGPGPVVPALLQESSVTVAGMLSDRFTWRDASLLPRSAVLAHNTGQTGPGGTRGGELRELQYQTPAGTRIVRASGSGASGFGYVVAHPDGNGMACRGGDSSSLGHFTTGQLQRVFTGRHHAIFRFTQNYPRLCQVGGTPPVANIPLPVTLDWMFATGRDHPLLALTWDMNAIAVNTLRDDVRGPYGELLFDGAANEGAHSVIAGVGWGDRFKFQTTSAPVTLNSSWTWNTANSVPYVKLWTTAVDATMGTVLTQTIDQQDAGGYFGANRWNTTSASGNACTLAIGGIDHLLPCNFNWPYQSINYSLVGGVNTPTNNTRLAWGSNFGFLGQSSYFVHGSAFWGGPLPNVSASGWPRKSYSTFVVLDRHSIDPVGNQLGQIETAQNVTVTAMLGSVANSGPAGVNRPDTIAYTPTGYDPVYSAWSAIAAGNQLDMNFAIAAGILRKPLIIVRNYTSAVAPTVRLNNQLLDADSGYFASLRPDTQELWITLNADLTGADNRVQIGF